MKIHRRRKSTQGVHFPMFTYCGLVCCSPSSRQPQSGQSSCISYPIRGWGIKGDSGTDGIWGLKEAKDLHGGANGGTGWVGARRLRSGRVLS